MTTRIHGVDLARGLAILGMMFAHFAGSTPTEGLVAGYPSTLFAVVAGVSLAIMASRIDAPFPLLARGAIYLAIGLALSNVPVIAEALTSLALIYLFLFWVPRMSTRMVLVLFALLVLANELQAALLLSSSPYPVVTWLAYGTAGVLLHRVIVRAPGRLWWVLLGAVALAVPAIWWRTTSGWTAGPSPYQSEPLPPEGFLAFYTGLSPMAHSGTLGDILCTGSVAVAVISLCVLLCRAAAAVALTLPVRSIGRMALTVYVLHVITAGFYLGSQQTSAVPCFDGYQDVVAGAWQKFCDVGDVEPRGYWWAFAISALTALILAPIWFRFFSHGPLEHVVAKLIKTADTPARTP